MLQNVIENLHYNWLAWSMLVKMSPLQWVVQEQDLFAFEVTSGYTESMVGTIHGLAFLWNEKDKKESWPTKTKNHRKLFENVTEKKHELTAPINPSRGPEKRYKYKSQSIQKKYLRVPCCWPLLLSFINATSMTFPCSSNKGRIWQETCDIQWHNRHPSWKEGMNEWHL